MPARPSTPRNPNEIQARGVSPVEGARIHEPFEGRSQGVFFAYEFGNPAQTLTAVGRVDTTGKFAFMRDGRLVRAFSKPPTRDAFFCDGALLAPNDEGGKIAAILGAGFNRTNLLHGDTSPQCAPAKFYTNPKTNTYSKILHEHAIGGVAYGFAFDDVCNLFSTYILDPAPKQLEVTLGALT